MVEDKDVYLSFTFETHENNREWENKKHAKSGLVPLTDVMGGGGGELAHDR